MISQHLDKNNLHHAYLIEGVRDEIIPEIFKFLEDLGVKTANNPDFYYMSFDSFKIDDAHNLKSIQYEKSFSLGKKIILISANNFLLEAQNTLLKIFEEPIENTHFFLIVPNKNILLKTLLSRFYLIQIKSNLLVEELKYAEKFILMPLKNRLDFIKELLVEEENEDEEDSSIQIQSTRAKALRFLNALEFSLQNKIVINFSGLTLPGIPVRTHTVQNSLQLCFAHIFKIREFINQPGSSVKNLMESIALKIPNF
ncbi:hypothetical protein COX93_03125 [Candidatus Nomurabacteria bacterium CG_4_10_14_0_2_um_filter_30_12]|uniref:Uncharacterized protein n=2 Tax=Candidatus Nomuraibacteriota TaxID=1752729 RepID=A0A2J0MEZ2_9BACT|nr:MAG: hypothetical protein COU48_01135 [Candidatus Nomurabacteria bacterium CG10_big_fil_rev_8_21_14_0_10_03_31_7]PIZ86799.1 MAG: hypothetical protein COX93_03125 [Candidatus Nomurabacteria bacterium CG_4_10_14_0_2_um_filter_30_12]